MSVRVMICYARSGGTILNQCLGCLPGVVILSEVNPLAGAGHGPSPSNTVKLQARRWYGIELQAADEDFAGGVIELQEICARQGRHLVVRDWPWANFMPIPENGFRPPRRLLTLEALDKRTRIIPFAFVRDAIDVYLSSAKFATHADNGLEAFADSYLAYVQAIRAAEIPVFKYENFTADPASVLKGICEATGLPFSADYERFADFRNVNGDIQFGAASRGLRLTDIRPLARRRVPPAEARAIDRCRTLARANAELDYAPAYSGRGRASRPAEAIDRLIYTAVRLPENVRQRLRARRQRA